MTIITTRGLNLWLKATKTNRQHNDYKRNDFKLKGLPP
jgi:hypothetical protein